MLPGRLVHARKRRDPSGFAKPIIQKMQQRPAKRCHGKANQLPEIYRSFHIPPQIFIQVNCIQKQAEIYEKASEESFDSSEAVLCRRMSIEKIKKEQKTSFSAPLVFIMLAICSVLCAGYPIQDFFAFFIIWISLS